MRDKLRRRYQVYKEVARNGSFAGEIPLAGLDRLAELLYSGESARAAGGIQVSFEFVSNEYGLPMLTGQLSAQLELECQRCLGAMELPVEQDLCLLIDASDEVVRDSSLDTLYSDDGYIDMFEVIEDELILAIPLVVRHDDQACNRHWSADADDAAAAAENPFAALRALKTNESN